jgi:hypothetical protein
MKLISQNYLFLAKKKTFIYKQIILNLPIKVEKQKKDRSPPRLQTSHLKLAFFPNLNFQLNLKNRQPNS